MTTSETTARASFTEAFLVWLKIGCINFGGPAGQIALMHRIVVGERKGGDGAGFLHAAAGPGGTKACDLSGLADAWRAWRPRRRHPVCAARRVRDAWPESSLRAWTRDYADRRGAVRNQGGGAGDRDRGADPHWQARAQNRVAPVTGGGRVCGHFLPGGAFSDHRRCSGADRLCG